jgi:hypothetical protein
MSKRRDNIELSRHYLVQHRQIGAENFTGSRIQREEAIDDPALELIFVGGNDYDMELLAPHAFVFPSCKNSICLMFFATSSGVVPYGSPCKTLMAFPRACCSESNAAA